MDLDAEDESPDGGERQAEAAAAALCRASPSTFALALDIGEARLRHASLLASSCCCARTEWVPSSP